MGITPLQEFAHIFVDNSFPKELEKCLSGYSNRQEFNDWFLFSLNILNDPESRLEYPRFEPIEKGIYSMRYRGKKNIRILFCKSNGFVKILSCAFEENNKSDYELAKKRVRNYRKMMVFISLILYNGN